jgi:UV DNA damage repair endonuclease
MGGIYGDKESTLARFKENYTTRLSDAVKKRLVLENDEVSFLGLSYAAPDKSTADTVDML